MHLRSPAFDAGGAIPATYTCDGADVSPPLRIEGIPDGTAALVLVMDDPDAPGGTWDHWVLYDIPVSAEIPENVADLGIGGENSWGDTGYGGPCPPAGTHRYVFAVFAVSEATGLDAGASKAEVYAAIEGTVLAEAVLEAKYGR